MSIAAAFERVDSDVMCWKLLIVFYPLGWQGAETSAFQFHFHVAVWIASFPEDGVRPSLHPDLPQLDVFLDTETSSDVEEVL